MSKKLLLTPTEINVYACSAIVSQLCEGRTPAEACSAVDTWPKFDILYKIKEFLLDEFFWDVEAADEHASAIWEEMLRVAGTVQVGIDDIETAFVEAGAPVTD